MGREPTTTCRRTSGAAWTSSWTATRTGRTAAAFLGLLDHHAEAHVLFAVHLVERALPPFPAFHLHKAKALALPRVTVGHNFYTLDRPHGAEPLEQIRFNRVSVEFGHKQFHQSRNRTAPSYANLRSLEPFKSI